MRISGKKLCATDPIPDGAASRIGSIIPCDLFGFAALKPDGMANPLKDIAFDEEPCSSSPPGIIPLQQTD